MTQPKVHASLRILNLALNLLNTRIGLSRSQLMTLVEGYSHSNAESARRAFERDIEHLRRAGLVVEVRDDFEEARYLISRSSLATGAIFLSERETMLLLEAAQAWSTSGGSSGDALTEKLKGYTVATLRSAATRVHFDLEEASGLATIQEAIDQARPISFEYFSRTGKESRSIAPWKVVVRGRALYVWGFDLDRWEPRLFRLSRFLSAPDFVGDAGAVASGGPLAIQAFDPHQFLIRPLLWVRDGDPQIEAWSRPARDDDYLPFKGLLPEGAQLRVGEEDDAQLWEQRIMREADAVTVLEPDWLANTIDRRLRVASSWGGQDG